MPDAPALLGALQSLKTASDILKILRSADAGMEKAELKLKIAELAELLADARMGVLDAREEIQSLQTRVEELEAALDDKAAREAAAARLARLRSMGEKERAMLRSALQGGERSIVCTPGNATAVSLESAGIVTLAKDTGGLHSHAIYLIQEWAWVYLTAHAEELASQPGSAGSSASAGGSGRK